MIRTKAYNLLTIVVSFGLILFSQLGQIIKSDANCSSWSACQSLLDGQSVSILVWQRLLTLFTSLLVCGLVIKIFKKPEANSHNSKSFLAFFSVFLIGLFGLMGAMRASLSYGPMVNIIYLSIGLTLVLCLVALDHKSIESSYHWPSGWNLNLSDFYRLFFGLYLGLTAFALFIRLSNINEVCSLGRNFSLACQVGDQWSWWPRLVDMQVNMLFRYVSFAVHIFGVALAILTWIKVQSGVARTYLCSMLALIIGSFVLQMSYLNTSSSTQLGLFTLFIMLINILNQWKFLLFLASASENKLKENEHSLLRDIFDLTKPRLGSLVMSTVLVGLLLSPGELNFFKASGSFLFTFILVAGAAAFNCWLEKDVDALMERTKDRPLPAKRLAPNFALFFSSSLLVISLAGLLYFSNIVTALLGLVAASLYLFAYTPLKQKSVIALYVGAIPGAIPPVMGWTMVTGKMDPIAWSLFAILFIWQLPHFMAISIYLARDYDNANIAVYPNIFGERITKWAMLFLTVLLVGVSLIPWLFDLGVTDRFGYFAAFLGAVFIIISAFVTRVPIEKQELLRRWAKIYFYASIFYLPLLLGSMIYLT